MCKTNVTGWHHFFIKVIKGKMKYLNKILLVFSLIGSMACNEHNPISSDTEREQVPDRGMDFKTEKDNYRRQISDSISSIDAEIERSEKERDAENNVQNRSHYDMRISKRKERREEFRRWMDRTEEQTEKGWENFKSDFRNFFDKEKYMEGR
jgi:hypothetical protein